MFPNAATQNSPSRFGQAVWLVAALPILPVAALLAGVTIGAARVFEALHDAGGPPAQSPSRAVPA